MNSTHARLDLAFFFALIVHLAIWMIWSSENVSASIVTAVPASYEQIILSEQGLQTEIAQNLSTNSDQSTVLLPHLLVAKKSHERLVNGLHSNSYSSSTQSEGDATLEKQAYFELPDLDKAAKPENQLWIDLTGVDMTNDIQIIVEVFISETGHVDKVIFPESANDTGIEKIIERDIRQTPFIPAVRQNMKVPSHKFIEFAFGP